MSSIYASPKSKQSSSHLSTIGSSSKASGSGTGYTGMSSTVTVGTSSSSAPAPTTTSSTTTTAAYSHITGGSRRPAFSNYDSRLIALAMEGPQNGMDEDVWQGICIRVLPLFNGEGHKGFIEDINEMVSLYARKMIDAYGQEASQHITDDIRELIWTGMLTLESKLSDLRPDRFLARLNELWSFFLTGVLPYLQGIFLPLSIEASLSNMLSPTTSTSHTYQQQQPSQASISPSHRNQSATKYAYSNASDRGSIRSVSRYNNRFDVRKIALVGFRDYILVPRLSDLLTLLDPNVFEESIDTAEDETVLIIRHLSIHSHAKRIQMFSMLLTADSEFKEVEDFRLLLRQVLELSERARSVQEAGAVAGPATVGPSVNVSAANTPGQKNSTKAVSGQWSGSEVRREWMRNRIVNGHRRGMSHGGVVTGMAGGANSVAQHARDEGEETTDLEDERSGESINDITLTVHNNENVGTYADFGATELTTTVSDQSDVDSM